MPSFTAQTAASANQFPAGTSEKPVLPATLGSPASRYKKVTACARVTVSSGLKVVALVPLVTPVSTAHWTAQRASRLDTESEISAKGLLLRNPHPTAAQIKEALEGNLCRCTGYVKIIAAVQQAAGEGSV